MNKRSSIFLLVAIGMVTMRLWAQQPCPTFSVAIGTDEDKLMLAINGAENPQDQLAALDKFVPQHGDSKFMPCVNEYYASVNLKLNNFDKSIEYGEKDLAANYQDLNLLLNLMRAYVSSAKVSDTIFDAINKVPDQVKTEIGARGRPSNVPDADWEKMQKEGAELAKDCHDVALWAFFQLVPRLADPAKRIQVLDNFVKTYPDAEKDNAAQVNSAYFQAYQMQGNLPKAVEYGDKAIAADPNNVVVGNTMGMIYAFGPTPSPDKAADYAQKALTAAQALKKPEGVDDAVFKRDQNNQMGIAHLVLGNAAFAKAQALKTKKFAPAIEEFKAAGDLLEGNPALQGQALYYLAFSYESGAPANHHAALDALNKAVTLPGPFQAQAQALLPKVKAVAK